MEVRSEAREEEGRERRKTVRRAPDRWKILGRRTGLEIAVHDAHRWNDAEEVGSTRESEWVRVRGQHHTATTLRRGTSAQWQAATRRMMLRNSRATLFSLYCSCDVSRQQLGFDAPAGVEVTRHRWICGGPGRSSLTYEVTRSNSSPPVQSSMTRYTSCSSSNVTCEFRE